MGVGLGETATRVNDDAKIRIVCKNMESRIDALSQKEKDRLAMLQERLLYCSAMAKILTEASDGY